VLGIETLHYKLQERQRGEGEAVASRDHNPCSLLVSRSDRLRVGIRAVAARVSTLPRRQSGPRSKIEREAGRRCPESARRRAWTQARGARAGRSCQDMLLSQAFRSTRDASTSLASSWRFIGSVDDGRRRVQPVRASASRSTNAPRPRPWTLLSTARRAERVAPLPLGATCLRPPAPPFVRLASSPHRPQRPPPRPVVHLTAGAHIASVRGSDLRVMSPNLGSRWTTWGTVSSGFREIELCGDRLGSVGHVAPFVAPADSVTTRPGDPMRRPQVAVPARR
jgi:hypothetical protein